MQYQSSHQEQHQLSSQAPQSTGQSSSSQSPPSKVFTGNKDVMWGFLSTAEITNKVKRAVDESSNGKVIAIASRNVGQADEWVKEHMEQGQEITAYGTYDALFNDKRVQIVYCPLPSGLKKEWAIKAAHNKYNVLCEKPFTSAAEVAVIINACKQNNVCFWDNSMFVHHPRTKEIMNLIKSGELGEIRHINSEFNFVLKDNSNIRYNKETEPRGALGDLGWYPVKATLLAMGMELPTKVFATASYKNGVIESCCAILFFRDPLKGATIHCGFTSSMNQAFTVSGTHKTLTCDDLFFPYHADSYQYPQVEQTGLTCYQLRDGEGRLECRQVRAQKNQETLLIEKFGELAKRKKNGNLKAELEEKYCNFALGTQKVLDAIEASCQSGGVVEIK